MQEFLQGFYEKLLLTSPLELIAVLSAVVYVVLAARQIIWCWAFAALASAIFVYLCIFSKLYIESILQLFYFVMAIYGWLLWKQKLKSKETFKIVRWTWKRHLFLGLISLTLMFVLALLFDFYTDTASPYLDAFTTSFSFAATFMVAKKVLENWLYWILIDGFSVVLYSSRDLNLTAVLYIFYTFIAIFGFISWYKSYQKQQLDAA